MQESLRSEQFLQGFAGNDLVVSGLLILAGLNGAGALTGTFTERPFSTGEDCAVHNVAIKNKM